MIRTVVATLGKFMLPIHSGRRTQVVKGEVCKTSMQRFESARRLQIIFDFVKIPSPRPLRTKKTFRFCANFGVKTAPIASFSSGETTAL